MKGDDVRLYPVTG